MNERSYRHINVLLRQRRYPEAEKLIKEYLSQDVDNSSLRYMLAIVQIQMDKSDEAEQLLRGLLAEDVDPDYLYYLAEIDNQREHFTEAEQKLREAITLDPDHDDYYASLAQNLYLQKKFDEAITIADQGLSVSPEHIDLANIRAACLVKLGRRDQAYESLDKTLERDPENSNTHATYAWTLLHQGKNKEALTHFQTALRLNPNSQYAQQGILEAMKSKFWIYRSFLRLMLWMSKFSGGKQWVIVIGAYLSIRVLRFVAETTPALAPLIIPIIVLLVILFLGTWIIQPLFNLYLMTNPFGRLTLGRDEQIMARCTGLTLMVSIFFGVFFLIFSYQVLLLGAIGFALLMIPTGSMLNPRKDNNKKILAAYSAGLFVLLAFGLVTGFVTGHVLNVFLALAAIGLFVYQWVANILIIR